MQAKSGKDGVLGFGGLHWRCVLQGQNVCLFVACLQQKVPCLCALSCTAISARTTAEGLHCIGIVLACAQQTVGRDEGCLF